jgi:hypothetical protein
MSRRHHTAHDLASLRIDLFGETAKAHSSQIFGRKARGTVDRRGNVSATIPFKQRKRKRTDNQKIREEGLGEAIPLDGDDEAFSGGPRKKKRTYYPGILPFLDISEDAGNRIRRLENGQPTAVSIYSPSPVSLTFPVHPVIGPPQEDTPIRLRVLHGPWDVI